MLLEIFAVLLFPLFIIFCGVFGHRELTKATYQESFKKIKIKRLKVMFQTTLIEPIDKVGIIVPLFIIQTVSYIVAVVTLILGICLLVLNKNPIVPIVFITLSYVVVLAIYDTILYMIRKKTKKFISFQHKKVVKLNKKLNFVSKILEEEIQANDSKWDKKILYTCVKPEIDKLIFSTTNEKAFLKSKQSQDFLESINSYMFSQNVYDVNDTKLCKEIIELQKIYNNI